MRIIEWKYVKPLESNGIVEEYEAENGLEFPADYKECVKENNAGRPNLKLFDTEKSKGRMMKALLSFNKSPEQIAETIYDAYDIVKVFNLFPIANDPAGNYICYNEKYEIVLWLHENDSIEYVAGSFNDFLNSLYSDE